MELQSSLMPNAAEKRPLSFDTLPKAATFQSPEELCGLAFHGDMCLNKAKSPAAAALGVAMTQAAPSANTTAIETNSPAAAALGVAMTQAATSASTAAGVATKRNRQQRLHLAWR